jgi:hypothetical protein
LGKLVPTNDNSFHPAFAGACSDLMIAITLTVWVSNSANCTTRRPSLLFSELQRRLTGFDGAAEE